METALGLFDPRVQTKHAPVRLKLKRAVPESPLTLILANRAVIICGDCDFRLFSGSARAS